MNVCPGPQELYYNGHEPGGTTYIKLTTDRVGVFHQTTGALICTIILKVKVTGHVHCPQRVQHDVTRDRDVAFSGKQRMCAVTFTFRIIV